MRFPFDPAPATLWTLIRDDKRASCEIAFVPSGTEIRVMREGRLLFSRVFASGDEALKEAGEERERMMAAGWRTTHETSEQS